MSGFDGSVGAASISVSKHAYLGQVKAARIGLRTKTESIELPSSPRFGIAECNNDPRFAFAVEYLERARKANLGDAAVAIEAIIATLVTYKQRCDVAMSVLDEKFPEGDLKRLLMLVLNGHFSAFKVPTAPPDYEE